MAASFEQDVQTALGAYVWMCKVEDKWGEPHWAQYGAAVAAALERAWQSNQKEPVQFSWTTVTAPQVVIVDSKPTESTPRAPAPKAARADKGPMLYNVSVLEGIQENQDTKARRQVARFITCKLSKQ